MGFEQFAGNQRIIDTLRQMTACGRLPHAILLEGDEGLGKFTLAKIIAKAAVCGKDASPCDNCHNCHLADIGNHPDIIITQPDGKHIKVDTVRELIEKAYLKPSQAQKKVFIIKDAAAMKDAGQNALLKTLEEPPAGVIFILLAESAAALLPTVVSRCTVFTLSAPDTNSALEVMQRLGFEKEEALQRLDETAGNIGRAATKKGKKSKISPAEFIELIAKGDAYAALLLLKKLEKDRNGALTFFEQLHTYLLTARKAEALGRGFSGLSGEYMRYISKAAEEAEESTLRGGNLTLIFHTLCLKISR